MTISVLIPVYNGAAHLADALGCVAQQDFRDWEVVVVDDGSTDDTAAIVEAAAAADSRVRLVRQANGGVSVARNRAMDEARGDWLVWLDADDGFVPGALGLVASLAAAHPDCQALLFPYFERSPDGTLLPVVPTPYRRHGGEEMSGAEAFSLLFARRDCGGANWQPWRFAYRADSKPRFRPGSIHEDVEVLPLHLATLPRVFVAASAVYAYKPARAGAATEAFTPRRVRDILAVTERTLAALAAAPLPERDKRGFRGNLAFNLFGYFLASARFDEPDRSELLAAFEERVEWLRAIDRPWPAAIAKRALLRLLGARRTAAIVRRVRS